MYFLFLEFLGTTELMVIAFVALIIFGPRKLPELGRSLGKSLGEFKRASEDFKRTWEYEVEVERSGHEKQGAQGAPVAHTGLLEEGAASSGHVTVNDADAAAYESDLPGTPAQPEQTIARNASGAHPATGAEADGAESQSAPARKQDWL